MASESADKAKQQLANLMQEAKEQEAVQRRMVEQMQRDHAAAMRAMEQRSRQAVAAASHDVGTSGAISSTRAGPIPAPPPKVVEKIVEKQVVVYQEKVVERVVEVVHEVEVVKQQHIDEMHAIEAYSGAVVTQRNQMGAKMAKAIKKSKNDQALLTMMSQKLKSLQIKVIGSAAVTLGKQLGKDISFEDDAATLVAKQQRAHRKMQYKLKQQKKRKARLEAEKLRAIADKQRMAEKLRDQSKVMASEYEKHEELTRSHELQLEEMHCELRDYREHMVEEREQHLSQIRNQNRDIALMSQAIELFLSPSEVAKLWTHSRWDADGETWVLPTIQPKKGWKSISKLTPLDPQAEVVVSGGGVGGGLSSGRPTSARRGPHVDATAMDALEHKRARKRERKQRKKEQERRRARKQRKKEQEAAQKNERPPMHNNGPTGNDDSKESSERLQVRVHRHGDAGVEAGPPVRPVPGMTASAVGARSDDSNGEGSNPGDRSPRSHRGRGRRRHRSNSRTRRRSRRAQVQEQAQQEQEQDSDEIELFSTKSHGNAQTNSSNGIHRDDIDDSNDRQRQIDGMNHESHNDNDRNNHISNHEMRSHNDNNGDRSNRDRTDSNGPTSPVELTNAATDADALIAASADAAQEQRRRERRKKQKRKRKLRKLRAEKAAAAEEAEAGGAGGDHVRGPHTSEHMVDQKRGGGNGAGGSSGNGNGNNGGEAMYNGFSLSQDRGESSPYNFEICEPGDFESNEPAQSQTAAAGSRSSNRSNAGLSLGITQMVVGSAPSGGFHYDRQRPVTAAPSMSGNSAPLSPRILEATPRSRRGQLQQLSPPASPVPRGRSGSPSETPIRDGPATVSGVGSMF